MDKKQEFALFKYKLIAPVLVESNILARDYFREASLKEYDIPGLGKKKFSAKTFVKWLHLYRKHGFEGLMSFQRKDKGHFRKISTELLEKIKHLLSIYQFRTVKNLHEYLINENIISPQGFTYATLNNVFNAHNLKNFLPNPKARKAFETEHIHSLWMVDFMHGPYVKKGRHKVKSYLCAIIDDYSRFIMGAQFFETESNYALEITLKDAISIFGIPNRLYSDNGKVFLSGHLSLIAARVGFILIHSKPYDAASRGKIERYFRTVRDRFIPFFHIHTKETDITLENLNAQFSTWLKQEYHMKEHSSFKMKPYDRYFQNRNITKIRVIEKDKLDKAFMHVEHRTVAQDSTITIHNIRYEVPPRFINKKIEIRYQIEAPDSFYIFENEQCTAKAIKLDKKLNSHFPIRFNEQDLNFSEDLPNREV